MARERKKESWEHPAEELVRQLDNLLGSHWSAIERALEYSMSHDQAAASLRQLEHLTRALDAELWRKGQTHPGRRIVGGVAGAVLVVLGGFGAQLGGNLADDAHDAVGDAEKQANEVVVCVLSEDQRDLGRPDGAEAVKELRRRVNQEADLNNPESHGLLKTILAMIDDMAGTGVTGTLR